jgi:hypothetical protein
MRFLYFYSSDFPEAVAALPKGTEMIYTGNTPYDWWNAFRKIWGTGDDLVTIDHDVVLVPEVEESFENCPEPWCVFTYGYGEEQLLCHSMGCTRFRKEIQGPMRCADQDNLTWNNYDAVVRITMIEDQGLPHPHVHFPPLKHLHPGVPMPPDPYDLWHKMFDDPHESGCRGYCVRVSDSDACGGSDTVP